ncbi:MAG TPA: DUF1684 domain-containing protein [Blastocatellia bacterium]|nr:DUF1684 domain-containing protein [Blastocatellia bacterium]
MTIKIKRAHAILAIALMIAIAPNALSSDKTAYREKIQKWRAEQEAELRSDNGWLVVVGLFWLKEGANSFGTDPSNEIVLPEGSAPARAGAFEFHDGKTTLRVENGTLVTVNNEPVTTLEMRSDEKQKPDIARLGSLQLHVIKRGQRYGVRVKDGNSRARREFTGRRWFPIRDAYRITATFVRYDKPKEIEIPNVLGDINKMPSPGYVTFKLDGKQYRIEPVLEGEDKLFFIFSDLTSGRATYGAGRFLYADLPEGGTVTLDFNQAINPPCAFTRFATCPLPPRQNRLKVAIEAGELSYGSNSEHN